MSEYTAKCSVRGELHRVEIPLAFDEMPKDDAFMRGHFVQSGETALVTRAEIIAGELETARNALRTLQEYRAGLARLIDVAAHDHGIKLLQKTITAMEKMK